MLLNSLSFRTGGQCTLSLEQAQGWLRATWSGYVTPSEAMSGALNYLAQAGPFHSLYLLNDNTHLQGPWFDSLDWLERVWLPQAIQLGLRYIAHVVQADTHYHILMRKYRVPITDVLELQLFDDLASALVAATFRQQVERHFRAERKVGHYAALQHLSPKHFSTLLRQQTGKTAGQWIDERVVLEARTLLQYPALTIGQVAQQLGFDDAANFSKYFRNLTGQSPRQYQRETRS